MDDLPEQIRDATRFLSEHRQEMLRLSRVPKVELAVLDFGFGWKTGMASQSARLPPDLFQLAGALGLSIQISYHATA